MPVRRATAKTASAGSLGALVLLGMVALPSGAEAAGQAFANICTGLGVTVPTLTPVANVTDNTLTGLLAPVAGDLNTVVSGVNTELQTQLSGKTLAIGVLDPTTGSVVNTPNGSCYVSASGLSIDNNLGLSLGGGVISGLGATGNTAATAGDATAIALGNGSSTATGALNAVALGTNAVSNANNGVALGASSVASRGAQIGYTAFGLAGAQTSAGEVSIGSATATRQLTNLAAGTAATDAVNVAQLTGVAQNLGTGIAAGLGGGAVYNTTTGSITGPVYNIGGQTYNNIGSALSAANALAVTYTPNLSGAATNAIDLTKGNTLAPVVISGLANGTVVSNSTQAVNGGELYAATEYMQTNSTLAAATAFGANSTAIGPGASTTNIATNAIAIGNAASATVANGIAIGSSSVASRAAQTYTDPFSQNSVTTTLGAVSVGTSTQQRQITNVAAGLTSTDAVNVGQLTSAIAPVASLSKLAVQYVPDILGNPTAVVDLSSGNGLLPTGTTQAKLTGIAPGVLSTTSTDAVNGAQLNATNLSITTLQNTITNDVSNLVYNSAGTTSTVSMPLARGAGSVAAGGGGTQAVGQYSTALGFNAQALTQSAVAIGQNATAMNGIGAVAIGSGNMANGAGAVSIGDPNVVSGTGAVGLGANNTATGQGAVGIGNLNQALGNSAIAFGDSAIANGVSAIALGQSADAALDNTIAIGNAASATGVNSVALGAGSTDSGQSNVVSIGSATQTRKLVFLSAGTLSATSTDAVNGSQLYALGASTASTFGGGATYNTATGALNAPSYTIQGNTFNNVGSALGAIDSSLTTIEGKTGLFVSNNAANAGSAVASGANASAGGFGALAQGAASTVVGNSATDNSVANSTILGNGAGVTAGLTGSNAAIGQAATASTGALASYTAFGLTSAQTSAGEVSFGSAGNAHQLTNVAAGRAATDAVNVAQLQGATSTIGTSISSVLGGGSTYNTTTNQITGTNYVIGGNTYNNVGSALTALNTSVTNSPLQYSTSATPTTANAGVISNDVTLVGTAAGTPVSLHNVAAGSLASASTDAVNGGQLNATSTSITTILGGGATYNSSTGTVNAPTYTVDNVNYSTVGGAIGAINTTINGGGGSPYFYVDSTHNAALATGTDATAAGPSALASATNAVALGNGATASGTNSVALGSGSTDGGVANVVSVGAVGAERRIVNVAAGTLSATSTDAVNGSQLYQTNTTVAALGHSSVQYDSNGAGGTASSVTLASDQGGPVIIHNLAAGVASTDAATVGQVQTASANSVQYATVNGVRSNTIALSGGQPGGVVISNLAPGVLGTDAANLNQVQSAAATATSQSNAYTDQRISNLQAYTQQQIAQARKDAAGGTAVALAAAGLHFDDRPGKVSLGGAYSYYHNQMGIAFGISTVSDNGRVRVHATVAASPTVGHADIGAGVGASLALD